MVFFLEQNAITRIENIVELFLLLSISIHRNENIDTTLFCFLIEFCLRVSL